MWKRKQFNDNELRPIHIDSDFSRTSKNDSLISLKLHGKIYHPLKKYIIIDTYLSKRIFPNKNAKKRLFARVFNIIAALHFSL